MMTMVISIGKPKVEVCESIIAPIVNNISANIINFPFNFNSGLSDFRDSLANKIPVTKTIDMDNNRYSSIKPLQ